MSIKSFHQYLVEMSLSRAWQHFTDKSAPAGIVSAFRGGATYADNQRRTLDLAGKVRSAGYGYTFVDGHYVEAGRGEVEETSVAIFGGAKDNGRLKGLLRQLRNDYGQDSVLFKPEGTSHAFLLFPSKEEDVGEFHPNRAGDYMTRLRGRSHGSFVFEEFTYSPKTFFARWGQDVLDRQR